jgi:hypothetical protein
MRAAAVRGLRPAGWQAKPKRIETVMERIE